MVASAAGGPAVTEPPQIVVAERGRGEHGRLVPSYSSPDREEPWGGVSRRVRPRRMLLERLGAMCPRRLSGGLLHNGEFALLWPVTSIRR